MSEIKLLPCPFCGGEAEFDDIHNPAVNKIICTKCGMHTGLHLTSKRGVAQIWNTRKPMERIIERIENARQKYQRLVREQGEKEDEAMNIHFRGVMQIVKEEGGIE